MVKAYRTMLHNDMMVTSYSQSTAVGKLRKHLPDTPPDVRYDFPRYSIDEVEAVINYYYRQSLISHERFSEEKWKRIYYLANGNGVEIRDLVRFI
jgi:small subunit ribosomal protein S29